MQRIPIVTIPLDPEPDLLVRPIKTILAAAELPWKRLCGVTLVPGAVVDQPDPGDPIIVPGALVIQAERGELLGAVDLVRFEQQGRRVERVERAAPDVRRVREPRTRVDISVQNGRLGQHTRRVTTRAFELAGRQVGDSGVRATETIHHEVVSDRNLVPYQGG